MKIYIYNNETGEEVIREMTESEIKMRESEITALELEKQKLLEIENAKAAAKAELLDRLGITEDEAKLLLA